MASTNNTPEIDLDAIQKEVQNMSQEERNAELIKLRTRQKKQQKRQQGSGAQKAYQAKQRERFRIMKAQAIKSGEWDKINEEAEKRAEQELGNEPDAEVPEEVEA